jgi:tetratricopeptide (TPR) repeat protein
MWERFDFAPSLNMLGYANMQLGNMEAARSAFEDYIYNNFMHPNPYDSMGEYWEKMEKYQSAYDYYMMAYTMDSTFSISKERADALEDKKTPLK